MQRERTHPFIGVRVGALGFFGARPLQVQTREGCHMGLFKAFRRDVAAALERDPAARSWIEVLLVYPGVHALFLHRVAHALWRRRLRLVARIIAHANRFFTGIEIHPAAVIGPGCFIDHGMGVVIGETAEIGENVTLYQGVVLGGTGKEKGKRHPTIGDNVVVATGAKVLGSFRVGDNARIGAGSVVLSEVPPNSTVVGVPGRVVRENGRRVETINLDHANLPDPLERVLRAMAGHIERLETRVRELEARERQREQEREERAPLVGPADDAMVGSSFSGREVGEQ